jgi:hypothetical protein
VKGVNALAGDSLPDEFHCVSVQHPDVLHSASTRSIGGVTPKSHHPLDSKEIVLWTMRRFLDQECAFTGADLEFKGTVWIVKPPSRVVLGTGGVSGRRQGLGLVSVAGDVESSCAGQASGHCRSQFR